ncbi:MAG: protein kinase domain-containing protein, partial [Planctomycetota bacterium]
MSTSEKGDASSHPEGSSLLDPRGDLIEGGPGPVEIGPYRIIGSLGRGAMGVVYLAEHRKLGRKVALKVLPPGLAGDDEFVERFRREAAAASKLEHPGIVQIFGADEAVGTHYYAMQYIEGSSLRGECPAPRESARIVRECAEALAYAHKIGLVHRDVKPENILLRKEDRSPLIADFGLVREENVQTLTRSGQIVGTPAYMAPEQAEGSRSVDGRADQYALGATLYELLSGRRVFDAPDIRALLFKVVLEDPPPLKRVSPQVPRDLETITMKCLAKKPEDRYPSCTALAEDLGRFLAGESILAKPVGPLTRVLRRMGKQKALTIAVGFALAAASVGIFLAVQSARQRAQTRFEIESKYVEAMERGRDAFDSGDLDGALEAFVEALSIKSGDPEGEEWKIRAKAEAAVKEGLAALARKDWLRALACFERARSLTPKRDGLDELLRQARRTGTLLISGLERAKTGAIRGSVQRTDPRTGGLTEIERFDSPPGEFEVPEGVPTGEAPEGMALVPGGTFLSGNEELHLEARELPTFFMDLEEVSIGEYGIFVEAAKDEGTRQWRTPATWQKDPPPLADRDLPVTGVTWEQAYEFARWSGKHLPSDREWEKSARGVDGRAFPWGPEFGKDRCNGPAFGVDGPVERGRFAEGTSPYGVHDMAGNVAEWTATPLRFEGQALGDGRFKVMGGSFSDAGIDALKTSHFRGISSKRWTRDIGFRCAKFLLPRGETVSPGTEEEPGIYLSESYRPAEDRELRGTMRLRIRNGSPEPLSSWGDAWFHYLTRVSAVKDSQDSPLAFREEISGVPPQRRIILALTPPLGPGESRVLQFEVSSRLIGMPRFFRSVDRFRILHVPTVPSGR